MRKYLLAIIGLVLLLSLLAALGTATDSSSTFTVNTTDDTDDGSCDASHCSLREAINAATSNPGTDTIEFNIPITDTGYMVSGITGTWTISLTASLPTLSGGGTIISGTTQAVNQGDLNPDGPEIEIAGTAGMGQSSCLVVTSSNNVIHGLVINRCVWNAVTIWGTDATSNTVSGNYIGTDASGSLDLGNTSPGIYISDGAQNNVIGGDTPGERNVISGNDQDGVFIVGSGTNGNTISGNYIGTDALGSSDLGNRFGVAIGGGAQNNTIGGGTPGERNIISGNDEVGVRIYGTGTDANTVSGNYIGTDGSGSLAVPNSGGLVIDWGAQNNTIGGDTPGERNIISGNDQAGVSIGGIGTNGNTVSGNYIGTDALGSSDLGNRFGVGIGGGAQNNTIGGDTPGKRNLISGNDEVGVSIGGSGADSNTISGNYIGTDGSGSSALANSRGVYISDGAQNNVIGGDTEGERNVISGNDGDGVFIWGSGTNGNTVSGNYIGTDASGSLDLGNRIGVYIWWSAQNNVIGGDTEGERNVISGNDEVGVKIAGSDTNGNTITQNSIYSNSGPGIELGSGGNTELSPPTISSASGNSISGTAPANATVELFTGPDDEGKTYLTTVSADGSGNWSALGPFTLDTYVTATATDAAGNTSEFSTPTSSVYDVYLPLILKNY